MNHSELLKAVRNYRNAEEAYWRCNDELYTTPHSKKAKLFSKVLKTQMKLDEMLK